MPSNSLLGPNISGFSRSHDIIDNKTIRFASSYSNPIQSNLYCKNTADRMQVSNNVGRENKLDGQGKARREAARRRNSEWKINFNSRNSSRSNGSRPTAVQRSVIGRRGGAWVANRQRRRVRRRLNMSVINTGGGAHWRFAHFLLFVGRALCEDRKVLA